MSLAAHSHAGFLNWIAGLLAPARVIVMAAGAPHNAAGKMPENKMQKLRQRFLTACPLFQNLPKYANCFLATWARLTDSGNFFSASRHLWGEEIMPNPDFPGEF